MSEPDRTIPQRELRNEISKVLREVERGDTIRVTVDGRPVADLVPVSPRQTWVPSAVLRDIVLNHPLDPGFADDVRDLDEEVPDDRS
jgi:prevent-host-death family protein